MSLRRIAVAMIIIAAFFIALWFAADFLVDWLWFSSVGYLDVFLTIFGTKVALFIAVFAASAIVLWLNGALAHRLAKRQGHLPIRANLGLAVLDSAVFAAVRAGGA